MYVPDLVDRPGRAVRHSGRTLPARRWLRHANKALLDRGGNATGTVGCLLRLFLIVHEDQGQHRTQRHTDHGKRQCHMHGVDVGIVKNKPTELANVPRHVRRETGRNLSTSGLAATHLQTAPR
jgi:hypothetical protein